MLNPHTERENGGHKGQLTLLARLAFGVLSYFCSYQFRAPLAHLSRPVIYAHGRLRRAVSKVGLAGVDWQAHVAIPSVALLACTTVPVWSQVCAMRVRVADVL